jgi:signal transduction histidine kinase
MVSRQRFYEHITSFRYSIDVFWNRPIHVLHRFFEEGMLRLPGETLIQEAAWLSLQRPSHSIYEPLVVQQQNAFYLLDVHQLLLAQSRIHELTVDARRMAETKNQALLQAIPDLLLRVSSEGILLDMRGESPIISLTSIPALIGSQIWQCFPHSLASPLATYLKLAIASNKPQVYEDRFQHGSIVIDYEIRLIRSGEQEALVILRDISERKRIEEHRRTLERNQQLELQMQEMKRLSQLKDDFLSTVSHELRTPITTIKMAVTMLKAKPSAEAQQLYMSILEAECQREMNLINDLLDFQQLEAGTRQRLSHAVVIADWLPDILLPFEMRCGQQSQALRLNLTLDPRAIRTDIILLQRIVVELLNNACKYTPAGGEIGVEAFFRAENLTLIVENTCEDIAEEELTRIFDTFYRIPQQDRWRQGGTGLGLALVKQSVKWLEGTLLAQKQGDRFRIQIELPLAPLPLATDSP